MLNSAPEDGFQYPIAEEHPNSSELLLQSTH